MAGHTRRKFHYFRNRRNPAPDVTSLALFAAAAVGGYLLYKHVKADASVPVSGFGALPVPDPVKRAYQIPGKNLGTRVKVKRVPKRRVRKAGKRDRVTKQIIAPPMNGLEGMDGFSLSKAIKKVGSAVSSTVKKVTVPAAGLVQKVAPMASKAAATVLTAPLKITREAVRPIDPLNNTVGKALDKPLNAVQSGTDIAAGVVATAVTNGTGAPEQQSSAPATTVTETVYQDADGNVITEAQYNALMAQANEPVYQDADGNVITKAQYDALMAAYNASLTAAPVPTTSSPATGATSSDTSTPITSVVPSGSQESAVTYTSGGSATDTTTAPASTSTDTSASAAEVQAATGQSSGLSPVAIVGAAAAVPVLFSLFG